MKISEQRKDEAHRQHTEAIVAGHMAELFKRLPMLSGFWLRPDPDAGRAVDRHLAGRARRAGPCGRK